MKITNRIFSIPPYISTHWGNVSSLHVKDNILAVSLMDGELIEIPNLDKPTLDTIFSLHATFVEQSTSNENSSTKFVPPLSHSLLHPNMMHRIDVPFRLGMGLGSVDDISSALQHNPNQANTPEIPAEILNKIVAITKIVAPEGVAILPQPEDSCNCVHCQIARAMGEGTESAHVVTLEKEEVVSDAELNFQQWEITQTGDQLYSIVSKLDTKERYSVYLGHPIGCTCGKQNCEHIVAVLKS
jgi:hypothetical protein